MQDWFLLYINLVAGHIPVELQNKETNILGGHLLKAAQTSLRNSLYFRYYYYKVKNKKNANSAIIALARRMLEIIYVILKEKREYIEKPIDVL